MVVVRDLSTRRHDQAHEAPAPRISRRRALGHQLDPTPGRRLDPHRAGDRRPAPPRPAARAAPEADLGEGGGPVAGERGQHRRPAQRRRPGAAPGVDPRRGEQVGDRAQAAPQRRAGAPGQGSRGPDLGREAVAAADPQPEGSGAVSAQGAGLAGGGGGHGGR